MSRQAETVTIQVVRYRDPSGQPTCCADRRAGLTCRFLATTHFGTRDVCTLRVDHELAPRTMGYQRPDDGCELWGRY